MFTLKGIHIMNYLRLNAAKNFSLFGFLFGLRWSSFIMPRNSLKHTVPVPGKKKTNYKYETGSLVFYTNVT